MWKRPRTQRRRTRRRRKRSDCLAFWGRGWGVHVCNQHAPLVFFMNSRIRPLSAGALADTNTFPTVTKDPAVSGLGPALKRLHRHRRKTALVKRTFWWKWGQTRLVCMTMFMMNRMISPSLLMSLTDGGVVYSPAWAEERERLVIEEGNRAPVSKAESKATHSRNGMPCPFFDPGAVRIYRSIVR